MEVIKCEGNVMWAEFKCTDLVAFFFPFFLKLIPRRMEREMFGELGKQRRGSGLPVSAG